MDNELLRKIMRSITENGGQRAFEYYLVTVELKDLYSDYAKNEVKERFENSIRFIDIKTRK